MTAVDPADLPALLRLAEAAGGVHRLKLSRFRLLDIVCAEHGTRMAQVIGTPDGPVLLAETRELWQPTPASGEVSVPAGAVDTLTPGQGPNPGAGIVRQRTGVPVAVLLDDVDPRYTVECWRRCGRVDVWPAWIDAQRADGVKRARVSHPA